jgi:hypothetical protein
MKLKNIFAAVALALAGTVATAQTTGTVFTLQGNYVKAGVSEYGTLGSKGNTNPGLQYDNTGTGTFNSAYDYLTPGSPYEGFSVTFTTGAGATVTSANNNTNGYGTLNPITGGVLTNYSGIAYNGTTYDKRAVWTGENSNFSLINDVRFNNNQKFIDITSTLTAKVNMTNLYFGRFIDPDARAAAGDSSATNNSLGYSLSNGTVVLTNKNVVMSEATVSKYALGLYTAATNAGAGISNSWSNLGSVYYNNNNSGNGDYTIGFYLASLSAGSTASFSYAYIFGPTALAANETAVASGAGGGTAGEIPGCTAPCTIAGFDSGGGSTPAPVTEVSRTATTPLVTDGAVTAGTTTSTSTTATRDVTTVNARRATTVTTYQDVTTVYTTPYTFVRTTTPRDTVTWSDGTTTTESGTATTETILDHTDTATVVVTTATAATTTYVKYADTGISGTAGRFAQGLDAARVGEGTGIYERLDYLTAAQTDSALRKFAGSATYTPSSVTQVAFSNQDFAADPLSRVAIDGGKLTAKATSGRNQINERSFFWLNATGSKTRLSGEYAIKGDANSFAGGFERLITDRALVGVQLGLGRNSISNDFYTSGSVDRTVAGVYGLYNLQGWTGKLDTGYTWDNYSQNRNISEIAASNSGNTKGNSTWAGATIYTPEITKHTRLLAGVRQDTVKQSGFRETGDTDSAMTFGSVTKNIVTGYAGVRVDYAPNKTGWFVASEAVALSVSNPAVSQTATLGPASVTATGAGSSAVGYSAKVQAGYNIHRQGRVQLELRQTRVGDYTANAIGLQGSVLF